MMRQDLRLAVHHEVGPEIRSREELQSKSGLSFKRGRNRFVKNHAHHDAVTLRTNFHHGSKVIISIPELGRDG